MEKRLIQGIAYLIIVVFALIQIFPLAWLMLSSLKTDNAIITKSAFSLPDPWVFKNYVKAWIDGSIEQYFLNSILITAVCVMVTILLSGMISYAIARMEWKLNNIVLFVFLAGLMVPIHVTLIPLFIILKNLGLLGNYLGIILPYIAVGLPLGIFVFVNFIRNLPRELEQAAAIDGCNIYQTFFQIIFPVIMPAFSAVAIFTFLNVWNEFIMAATFINNVEMRTLPLGLMAFQGTYSTQWAPMSAAIVIASLPVVLFYIFFSNQVEKSFTAGAILK
jgi:raffinose/stachyose/melibiose transport system permease protein